ncbi:hypothetical protein K4F_28720 [Enterococcus hirae]|nr:hypothetical protein K4F_28720 [Enterococcus hirae]
MKNRLHNTTPYNSSVFREQLLEKMKTYVKETYPKDEVLLDYVKQIQEIEE